jgi:hypothetical protein
MIGSHIPPHARRNVCAGTAIPKQFGFPCKEGSQCEVPNPYLVDIHQVVMKCTTSAGAVRDVRDMRERRDSKLWPEIPKPQTSDL